MARRSVVSLLVAIGAAAPVACRQAPDPARVERVVLVTIDTLRADHLGLYGYPRPTSPFLDQLAGEGVVFRSAFASMATTAPSHASLLTSLHPVAHQVLKNGHTLDASFVTLAEMLKARGFRTAAFVSTNTHFAVGGLARGFELFDEAPEGAPLHRRPADQTLDRALAWLQARAPDERFLLWVHVFDPHDPYARHPEQRKRLAFPSELAQEAYLRFLRERHQLDLDFYGGEAETLDVLTRYDSEVLFVDDQLRRLHQLLAQRKLARGTLLIVTADHGEGLGNHRWAGHGKHVYNEQIRVPLVLRLTDAIAGGRVVDDVVQLVDVLPSVLELLELPLASPYPIHGSSFVPLLRETGRPFAGGRAFAQRRQYSEENRPRRRSPDQANFEDGERYSLQDRRYKYILWTAGESEFYDLERDFYETRNLVAAGGPTAAALRRELLALVERLGASGRGVVPHAVDPATIEKLKSLGYVQ